MDSESRCQSVPEIPIVHEPVFDAVITPRNSYSCDDVNESPTVEYSSFTTSDSSYEIEEDEDLKIDENSGFIATCARECTIYTREILSGKLCQE